MTFHNKNNAVKHCAIVNAISSLITSHAFWKVTVRTVTLILSLEQKNYSKR